MCGAGRAAVTGAAPQGSSGVGQGGSGPSRVWAHMREHVRNPGVWPHLRGLWSSGCSPASCLLGEGGSPGNILATHWPAASLYSTVCSH